MRECKVDSRDLVYENTDKLVDVGKSSELVQCIEDLPEDIPANDPRVELIVKSLFKIDAHPIEKPVSLRDLNESIKGNIASETKISIYEGEWPDMKAIPESDGGVFLALQGDGAHRLCAAKMRGDHELSCREISIVRLK